jgi:hypothetical protein
MVRLSNDTLGTPDPADTKPFGRSKAIDAGLGARDTRIFGHAPSLTPHVTIVRKNACSKSPAGPARPMLGAILCTDREEMFE